MESEVQMRPLGDLCDFLSGFAFKSGDLKGASGIPVVKIKNVNNKVVTLEDMQFFPEEKLDEKIGRFLLDDGDVLIAMTGQGSVGRVGRLRIPESTRLLLNQRVGKFIAKEGVANLDYIYYVISSEKYENILFNAASGSGQPNLSPATIKSILLPYIPYEEQVKISQVLTELDNKITLNRQINQTLEQMAQALFKSWFVDFDPVVDNALDAGFFEQNLDLPDELLRRVEARQAVRKQSDFKPLPDATRQLFPAAFEECAEPLLGLGGWVPKGWETHAISDIAFINKESWTKNNSPQNIKYVDLSNAKDGIILGIQEYLFEEAPSRARRVLNKRDTIFGMVRPANRSFAYVDRDGLTGSTGFVVISAKNENASSFIYQKLTSDSVVDELIRVADGAAYPAIKPDDISELMMAVPKKCILELFEKTIDGYRKRVAHNLDNNEQLAKLRDTLLPKLISGELRLDNIAADLATE